MLTLRELLLGMVFIGLGFAGLVAGGMMATIVLGVVMIVTIGVAIVAFVGRDEARATAIGFLVPVAAYAASLLAVGSSELDPYGICRRPSSFGRRFMRSFAWNGST